MPCSAVIYKSNYGFTKTYACWIAEELAADLLEANTVKAADLQKYDTLVYGGGLYAGGVNGLSLIAKNFDALKNKRLFLFTVGVADVGNAENTAAIRNTLAQTLTPEMREAIHLFHLRGGLAYSKMTFIHKIMMKMMHKMLLKKPDTELSSDDKNMLETYGQDISFVDRKTIVPLLADVRQRA